MAVSSKTKKGNGTKRFPSSNGKYWMIVSMAICCIIILFTTKSLFHNPQIEPDDYRYLHQVQLLNQNFWGNISSTSIVENRWDHLWWIDVKEKAAFFRPTIVLSYWLDVNIYGANYQIGLLMTNILIYTACVFLACLIFYYWLGPGIPLLLSSALFASFYAHSEVVWYIAGRTDSLAGLFVLGGLALHLYGTKKPVLRWLALPCFVLAVFTKELTLLLPVILFLHDWWAGSSSASFKEVINKNWKLYLAYAMIALCFLWIRSRMMSTVEAGFPYPYFVTPDNPNFFLHLWGQIKNYCSNLLLAAPTIPFTTTRQVQTVISANGFIIGIIVLCIGSYILRREKVYWLLLLLAVASWLPTVIVYISERYLFLPSFAVAGSIGLLLLQLQRWTKQIFYGAVILVLVWTGHQAYSRYNEIQLFSTPHLLQSLEHQLAEIKPSIPKGSKLLILNLPGNWLQAQFMQEQMRVAFVDPELEAEILTPMPPADDMGSDVIARKENTNTIVVESIRNTPVIMTRGQNYFPWVTFSAAKKYYCRSGITAEVLSGDGGACSSVRFTLPRALDEYKILKWNPDPNRLRGPYYRGMNSTIQFITLQMQ